jgi:hypothetical protein
MRSTALLQDERGIALPTAIFALVVIGALVAGIFFTARIEVRSGENTMSNARATEAAQAGLMMGYPMVLTMAGALTGNGQQAVDTKTQIGTTGSYYTNTVTQLNRYMYLLRSLGTYEVNGNVIAQRTLAMLVKKYVPELGVNSGAIVVGNAAVSGSASLNGTDQTPPGWTGCPAGADQPGLRTNGTASGNKLGTVVGSGTPPYTQADTTVTGMSRVMDTLFFQLAHQANFTFTANGTGTAVDTVTAAGTVCRTKLNTNWGDPKRTSSTHCENYFPIIYFNNGNSATTFQVHGEGQGVLLVNGNLQFNGNGHFAGLILVRGSFAGGTGNTDVDGSLISLNADLTDDTINGNIDIDFSSCAVNDALKNLAVTSPSTYRGFIQY